MERFYYVYVLKKKCLYAKDGEYFNALKAKSMATYGLYNFIV